MRARKKKHFFNNFLLWNPSIYLDKLFIQNQKYNNKNKPQITVAIVLYLYGSLVIKR